MMTQTAEKTEHTPKFRSALEAELFALLGEARTPLNIEQLTRQSEETNQQGRVGQCLRSMHDRGLVIQGHVRNQTMQSYIRYDKDIDF